LLKKKLKFKRKVRKKNPYYGIYKGISYRSALELAFILKCHAENKIIENFEDFHISYFFKGKQRKYYPDFLVDKQEIVEIKGLGFLYEKKILQIHAKQNALRLFCEQNPEFIPKFITNKDIDNNYQKQAKDIARKEETCRQRKKK
jgi:hypothetical protein